jgi:cytochrome c-type biogenesis protein CcmH
VTTPLLIVALLVIGLGAAAAVIAPLLRRTAQPAAAARFDRAVYRDQLREIERDLARGILEPRDAASARLEIERRLLATAETETTASLAPPRRRALAVAVAVLLGAWATGLYLLLGSPGIPDIPFAARGAESQAPGNGDIAAIAARLEARLKFRGGDADSWLLLARTEMGLRQWDKAAEAFRRVLDLRPDTIGSSIEVAYAEALTLAAGGIVTPAAKAALESVATHDPTNAIARFYLAMAAAQAGDLKQAIDAWVRLAGELPADSDMRAEIERRVGQAAQQAGIAPPALPPPSSVPAKVQ